ncbi:hypothetical protein BDZ89DRAFT_1167117 [Hymenopellis radicata]|nr:hypothetical protein BDZ89DRAFT_1167117 [Hymenopellis radicata]
MAPADTPTTTSVPLLPRFKWDNTIMKPLFDALWPHDSDGGLVEDSLVPGEPPALLKCIETLTPDDAWLGSNTAVEDSMDIDYLDGEDRTSSEEGDKNEGPSGVRFINLKVHSALSIEELYQEILRHGERATFIVRDEYRLFMDHAISCLRTRGDDLFRFFVTGHPGIGTSFGACYILFYLLASGQSVFYIDSPGSIRFFSSHGVQVTEKVLVDYLEIRDALHKSWVVIDIEGNTNWTPPRVFHNARCIVWTSSPEEPRMKFFIEHYGAEKWFLTAWTNKEIAALTERLGIPHGVIKQRLDTGGPVARSLFSPRPPPTLLSLKGSIHTALRGNIFSSTCLDVFLIQPVVVIDKASGRVSFQRTDYRVEYLSAYITNLTFELAENHRERLQGQLAAALNTDSTRAVAGKLMERMMHRALIRRIVQVPPVFGADHWHIAGTLQLIGKATNFVSKPERFDDRPLYLQPESLNFAAVDAILATDKKLGLLQTSLSDSHTRNFGMMLRIMARLPEGANVAVDGFEEVLYCLIGTDGDRARVQELVAQAKGTLEELQRLDSHELSKRLGMRHTNVAHQRLSTFSVVGYTFHHQHGFTGV